MLLPHARKWLHEWIPCTIITWAAGTEKFTLKKNLVHQVQVLTPCFSSCKQHLQRGFQTLTRWSKAFYNLLNSWSANWSSYLQGKETGAHQLGTRLFSSTTFGTGHSQVAQFLAMWNIMVSCHASNNKRLFTTQRYSCGSLGGKNAGKMFPYDEWWPPNCAEVVRVDECVAALKRLFSSSSFPRHLLNTSFKRWTLSLYLLLMCSHGGIPWVSLHLK